MKPFSQVLRSPSDFLKLVIGNAVVVRLHSGVDYRGMNKSSARSYFCRDTCVP